MHHHSVKNEVWNPISIQIIVEEGSVSSLISGGKGDYIIISIDSFVGMKFPYFEPNFPKYIHDKWIPLTFSSKQRSSLQVYFISTTPCNLWPYLLKRDSLIESVHDLKVTNNVLHPLGLTPSHDRTIRTCHFIPNSSPPSDSPPRNNAKHHNYSKKKEQVTNRDAFILLPSNLGNTKNNNKM